MEGVLSRKASAVLKKRASLSFFNSQKPTFTFSHDKTSPYYDFIDTPVHHQPPSPLIDRQKIDPELESEIRFSCSLLIYRIERGVPSTQQTSDKKTAQKDEVPPPIPQVDSKYHPPLAGPDVAALKDDRYDSGVALTAQPSHQTMRILQSSHSDRPSEADTVHPGSASIFSQRRCPTAGSATTCTDSASLRSRPYPEVQSVAGTAVHGHGHPSDEKRTREFLSGAKGKRREKPTSSRNDDSSDSDVEMFLASDAPFMSTDTASSFFSTPLTSLSNPSPSFGLPEGYTSNRQSKLYDGEPLERMPRSSSGDEFARRGCQDEPGVIVDSRGFMHVMTAEEESQRQADLRNAVAAKMGASSRPASHIMPPPPAVCADADRRSRSTASRLKESWSMRTKATLAKLSSCAGQNGESKKPSLFQRIKNFFGRWTKRQAA
ncbi:hypothetical protein BDV59DRAFT_204700 [Aspergillus ambiguus]|uniref:uncharacterized protein n=1 Tax=Aspergillus ambiguus TaxID=176160 RepID=UPI003CCE0BCB